MNRKNFRVFVAFLAICLLMVSLASCAQPAQDTPVSDSADTSTEQESESADSAEPEEEMVLRITAGSSFSSLSPYNGGGGPAFWLSFWWASPMYFDSEGELHPYIFNEWESNDDQTVWTFKIDPEAVYSDGSPITAQDIKASWDLCAIPTTKHQRVGLFFNGVVGFEEVISGKSIHMDGIVAVDDSTVEVTLTAPDPVYYQRIASNLIPPSKPSQSVYENGEQVFEWWHPKNGVITNGPFMPVEMDLDNGYIEFVKNPHFWMGEPKLDKVIFTAIDDPQVAITMIQNDQLDASNEIFVPGLIDEMGEDFVSGQMIPRGHQFWLDYTKEPMDDINVRKALILSIDPDGVFEAAFPNGPGQAVHQLQTFSSHQSYHTIVQQLGSMEPELYLQAVFSREPRCPVNVFLL